MARIREEHRVPRAAVAQLVEQWTENPCVISSILIGGREAILRGGHFFARRGGVVELDDVQSGDTWRDVARAFGLG